MRIVIVDYGIGNVQSILNVLNKFDNIESLLSDEEDDILNADGVILPGVGAYNNAMKELAKRRLPEILKKYNLSKKPILGICLGMQLLFDSSEEFGETDGLGLVKGQVVSFPPITNDKLPHIGWNEVSEQRVNGGSSIFSNISNKASFYFAHSYICQPQNKDIINSTTEYGGVDFCSSIRFENIYACQFHPEKSAEVGIKFISNFLEYAQYNK